MSIFKSKKLIERLANSKVNLIIIRVITIKCAEETVKG